MVTLIMTVVILEEVRVPVGGGCGDAESPASQHEFTTLAFLS